MNLHISRISRYLDVFIFFILLLFKIMTYTSQLDSNYIYFKTFLPSTISSVLILIGISLIFTDKGRLKFLYTCNIAISLMIVFDINYFRYFKDVTSILVLKNGFQLGAVKSSVASLFQLNDLLFFIDILFLPIIFSILRAVFTEEKHLKCTKDFSETTKIKDFKQKISNIRKKAPLFAPVIAAALIINIFSFINLSKEQPRLLTTLYNKVYITKNLGIINYHFLDLYNFVYTDISKHTMVSKETQEEIKQFLDTNSRDVNSDYKDYAKGKNLIMIQVEAFQQFVIDKSINDKEITPNLNRWIKKSMNFDNIYYQVSSGGTSDAEFMTNNSLYPAASGAAYFLYAGNDFNSLPKQLSNAGYETAALHGYKETFWNRNVMYKALGYDNFFSENNFDIKESIGLGLSDKEFLDQSFDKIKSFKNPFYAFMITLTSHYPYDDVTKYGYFDSGKFEGTMLGNYFKSIHYTDQQLGTFLDRLEEEGILNDTVVVIYGDHSAISRDKENELADFLGISHMDELKWAKLQKIPMFIHFPGDQLKGTHDAIGGQIDLYPTLSNLFGLNNSYAMGSDLLNSTKNSVIFRNGSFIDNNVYFNSQTNTFYDLIKEAVLSPTKDLTSKKDSVSRELQYSDEILNHNLIKKYNKITPQ